MKIERTSRIGQKYPATELSTRPHVQYLPTERKPMMTIFLDFGGAIVKNKTNFLLTRYSTNFK